MQEIDKLQILKRKLKRRLKKLKLEQVNADKKIKIDTVILDSKIYELKTILSMIEKIEREE